VPALTPRPDFRHDGGITSVALMAGVYRFTRQRRHRY